MNSKLTPIQKASGLTITHTVEGLLYWGLVKSRWHNNDNWKETRQEFFSTLPSFVPNWFIRPKVLKNLHGVGVTRYANPASLDIILDEILESLSCLLGKQPYFFGDEITLTDVCVFGQLGTALYLPQLNPEMVLRIKKFENLVAFCERIKSRITVK